MATDVERLIVQLSTDIRGFQNAMLKASDITSREARKIERRFWTMNKTLESTFRSTGSVVTRGLGALGLGIGSREVIAYADAWTRSKSRIQVAGVALSDVGAKQEELLGIANRSRTSFESVVELYGRLGIASRELGTNQKDLSTITETLSKAMQLGGANTNEAKAALLQFSQAIASGVLQGDELRSLRENAPLVAQAIAQEFGVTVGELKKLGSEGELTAERIMKAILKVAPAVEREFSSLPQTVGQAMTRLSNSTLELIGRFDEWSGSTSRLVGWMNALANVLDKISDTDALSSLQRQLVARRKLLDEAIVAGSGGGLAGALNTVPGLGTVLGARYQQFGNQRIATLAAEVHEIEMAIADLQELQRKLAAGRANETGSVTARPPAATAKGGVGKTRDKLPTAEEIGPPLNLIQEMNRTLADTPAYVDAARDAFGGFLQALRSGATFADALTLALDRLAAKLTTSILDDFFDAAPSIFRALVAPSFDNSTPLQLGYTEHTGGIAGKDGKPRLVPAGTFAGARRLHRGGLAGNEVPTILTKGEGVFTQAQMRALGKGGGSNVQVNVYAPPGMKVEQRERQQGGLNIRDIIISEMNRAIGTGRVDGSMARYGVMPVRRRTG